MDTKEFKMDIVYPCADYEGVTVEGKFTNIDLPKTYESLKLFATKISYFKSANIIICAVGDANIYIYEDGKFVISKIQSKSKAEAIINKLIYQDASEEE